MNNTIKTSLGLFVTTYAVAMVTFLAPLLINYGGWAGFVVVPIIVVAALYLLTMMWQRIITSIKKGETKNEETV